MSDASYELQQAIVRALRASSDIAALIEDRVYDRIPTENGEIVAKFPFVSFGPEQDIPEHADCIDGGDIVLQIDVWSREPGHKEAKSIADVIRATLNDAALIIRGGATLIDIRYLATDFSREPDGQTFRARLTFRAVTEP